jgi:short subunit dehydrogenase-like uncharacterized protein
MKAEVVIYGASGYTGKLIAWHLAEYGIPFIAAGRNQERLEEEMKKIPELEGHYYECIAVDHDEASLTQLFDGKKIVYNVVGPFMQFGDPVVKACLAAGCHYFDTTGEQDWMFHIKRSYGQKFAEQGLLVIPSCSFMWIAGLLAAELALEQPDIDTIDNLYLCDTVTSVASTMSFMRMLANDQYYKLHGELAKWPAATGYDVAIPGFHVMMKALPWSGGGETVWFENDERVRNYCGMAAFRDQEMVTSVLEMVQGVHASGIEGQAREKETNELGMSLRAIEPDRETREENRCVVSCHARGNTNSLNVVMRGNSAYVQTGVFAAEICKRVLLGESKGVGAISPAQAIGHRKLIAAVAERGYLSWSIKEL